jgi:putative ABC transport system ATP-binding protein
MPAVGFQRVSKSFERDGGAPLVALRDVSFAIETGERVAIVGRSGCGKSTVLNLAAGIESPSAGSVTVFDRDLAVLDDGSRARLRRDSIGIVFQFFHLLPHLSVLENVIVPARIAGDDLGAARRRASELLERVGLGARAADSVDGLSGGEQQRVALCRALLRKPRLLLADEPTGSLDDASGRQVSDLLFELTRDAGATLVLVTHSKELAALADRSLELRSGELHAP